MNGPDDSAPGFPADWPSECPPADANGPDGIFYRLVHGVPPASEDFVSYAEAGKQVPAARACEARGLSLFTDISDAFHYLRKFPSLGRGVASAALTDQHGKVKATPRGPASSHCTWWPFASISRHSLFQPVDP